MSEGVEIRDLVALLMTALAVAAARQAEEAS